MPVFYFFHQVYSSPGAAGWTIQASGSQGLPATDGVWHAVNGVIGPSAVIRVDDAEQAGTVTTFAGSGTIERALSAPHDPSPGLFSISADQI